MITRTFKLYLNNGNTSPLFINTNQYDHDETWLFELYTETGERYRPSSGAIIGIKSDGHSIANNGTVDSEGRVVITETEQMTAAAGRAIFELSIDDLTHGTENFVVNVERRPLDDGTMSESDLSLLQTALDTFKVVFTVDRTTVTSCNHTHDEIVTAMADGKEIDAYAYYTNASIAVDAPQVFERLVHIEQNSTAVFFYGSATFSLATRPQFKMSRITINTANVSTYVAFSVNVQRG